MKFILIITLFLTTSLCGQTVSIKVNGGKTDIYSDALTHYIDSVHHTGKLTFDTLFILNNEEFSESSARKTEGVIKKINIVFQDTASILSKLKYQRSLNALNINTDQNSGKERINIMIYSFIVTTDQVKTIYIPIKGCTVSYIYNNSKKEFEFKKISC